MTIFYSPVTNGFYIDGIHASFPDNSIEIDEQLYRDLLEGQSRGGQISFVNGLPAITPPAPIPLDQIKTTIKASIDHNAEACRLKYITPGAGQAMTYQQKSDEAARYLVATSPSAADYPLLSAEVGVTAEDIAGVAAVVDAAFRQWQSIGSAIEAVRLRSKRDIDLAPDADAARAVFDAIVWPTASATE